MQQMDLDDLPPKISRMLEHLVAGEDLVLVRGGLVVSRLTVVGSSPPLSNATPDVEMAEVMEQFGATIEDAF